MKYLGFLISLLCFAVGFMFAATSPLPPGTVLPAMLSTTLNSSTKPGKRVEATIKQDIPANNIPEGSKLVGHVVSVSPNQIVIQFDSLHARHQVIPISTSLRAIASMMDVEWAKLPTTGPDRGTSTADWNTVQIGGQAAYRRSDLMSDGQIAGRVLLDGSTLGPLEASSRGCSAGNTVQALWVFSSDACGVYGYPDLMIEHKGKSAPIGQIALRSNGKLLVRSGSGLLLRVVSAGAQVGKANENADSSASLSTGMTFSLIWRPSFLAPLARS